MVGPWTFGSNQGSYVTMALGGNQASHISLLSHHLYLFILLLFLSHVSTTHLLIIMAPTLWQGADPGHEIGLWVVITSLT